MIKYFYILTATLTISACNFSTNCVNKESFLTGFDKFIDDVKIHYSEIDINDWASIDKEYKGYIETCYPKFKEDLSIRERIEFWKNTLSYGVYRGANDEQYDFNLEDYGLNLEEEFETMSNEAQEELETFIKEEIGPELEGVLESLINDLEGLGDQLKEWLDDL